MYILVAILLLIVIIFGVSSGMQSYATAQQAQATIEVAQLGQINAWGNLVTILTIALALVIFVALVAAALWFLYKRAGVRDQGLGGRGQGAGDRGEGSGGREQGAGIRGPRPSLETLIQLETLRMLQAMHPPVSLPSGNGNGNGPHEDDEPLQWLR